MNWNSNRTFISMIGRCMELNIKFVKMQLFKRDTVPKDIQHTHIGIAQAQFFFNYAKARHIELFFTPMYPAAINICEEVGVNYYKIRYIDRQNLILYRKLKRTNKPIFVSTNHPDNTLFKNLKQYKKKDIRFLYCVPEYPADIRDYLFKSRSGIKPLFFDGISDHTNNLDLFKICNQRKDVKWFEMHVCLFKEDAYEAKWSKSFDEIEEALK